MTLAYAKKTGFGSYGPNPGIKRGATVWKLKNEGGNRVSVESDTLLREEIKKRPNEALREKIEGAFQACQKCF